MQILLNDYTIGPIVIMRLYYEKKTKHDKTPVTDTTKTKYQDTLCFLRMTLLD